MCKRLFLKCVLPSFLKFNIANNNSIIYTSYFFREKLRNSPEWTKLFYIPLLNLYPLCKITIGRVWFYCLILFIWFFVYLVYKDRNWCYSHYLQKLLLPICIVWVLSMGILLALLVKSIIYSRKLNKESSHEQNIK